MLKFINDFLVHHKHRRGKLWAATSLMQEPVLVRLADSLATAADQRHAERYRSNERQAQSLAARVLLRAVLDKATDVPGQNWYLEVCADGRTIARTDGLAGGLSVSVSHSRNRVACGLSTDGVIGVDIEHCRPDRDILAAAEYAFADDEIAAVRDGGVLAFYRIWTMREAVAKASGAGMAAMHGRRILTCPTADNKFEAELNGNRFLLDHRQLADGYSLSVAVSANGRESTR